MCRGIPAVFSVLVAVLCGTSSVAGLPDEGKAIPMCKTLRVNAAADDDILAAVQRRLIDVADRVGDVDPAQARAVGEGIPFELHVYPFGPHGLSLATKEVEQAEKGRFPDPHVAGWVRLCSEWLAGI